MFLKKFVLSVVLALSSVSAFAEIVEKEINHQCIEIKFMNQYLQENKANVLGYVEFKTESGHEAMDYAVTVDGKVVIVRQVPEAGFSCVLGEVPLNVINKNSKGNI